MAVIRWVLGRLILLFDFIFRPRGVKRASEAQQKVDLAMAGHSLYQYQACPFCVKVRRELKRQSVVLPLVDAKQDANKAELEQGGGLVKVPCLRIEEGDETRWMYESSEIIDYLQQRVQAA